MGKTEILTSSLWYYENNDLVISIIMELSKTNYLYIPLMARTDEGAIWLKKCIGWETKNTTVIC